MLEKICFSEIEKTIRALNPELADALLTIDNIDDLPLYVAKYSYGSPIIEHGILNLPCGDTVCAWNSDAIPSEIQKELGYNSHSNPITLVLEKNIEMNYLERGRVVIFSYFTPGSFFGTWNILEGVKTFHPTFKWNMVAGARSTFMLPKVSMAKRHTRLRIQCGVESSTPETLNDHFHIFQQIATNNESKWEAKLLFFGKEWFENLSTPRFEKFNTYLLQKAWNSSSFLRNHLFWNTIFKNVRALVNMRPSPYISDTVKHIISLVYKVYPGFAPLNNNEFLPLDLVQQAYTEVYGLEYEPTVIGPSYFDKNPIYYSLLFESAFEYSARDTEFATLVTELTMMYDLLKAFRKKIGEGELNLEDTAFMSELEQADIDIFHIKNASHARNTMIISSETIAQEDPRFGTNFSPHSPFIRAVVRIKHAE